MVTRPNVRTQATARRSSRRLFMTTSSGGMSSGIKAICTGMRFWLITAIAQIPASIAQRVKVRLREPAPSELRRWPSIQSASKRGSPEWATAIANAPSSAYESAIFAPAPRPSWKATMVPSSPMPLSTPPTSAPINRASTTCTRSTARRSIKQTATTTAFIKLNIPSPARGLDKYPQMCSFSIIYCTTGRCALLFRRIFIDDAATSAPRYASGGHPVSGGRHVRGALPGQPYRVAGLRPRRDYLAPSSSFWAAMAWSSAVCRFFWACP